MPRGTPEKGSTQGNFVSEWFGHTVWPQERFDDSEAARVNQGNRACPFLSAAVGKSEQCIKMASGWDEPYGVCTVSSDSNRGPDGQRRQQSWVACPYRTLDKGFALLNEAVRFFYDIPADQTPFLLPVSELNEPSRRRLLRERAGHQRTFLFSSTKLGGEAAFPETEFSPAASIDASVLEVLDTEEDGTPTRFGKHLLYEIQTADFHGSPLQAAGLLRGECPRVENPGEGYHRRLREMVEVCGTAMEGPNKSNIFKRTIYQMILKIALSDHTDCAGFAIFIPEPVWDSWLKHLGNPNLVPLATDPDTLKLSEVEAKDGADQVGEATGAGGVRARVYVFDIVTDSPESPRPLRIVQKVECSATALAYHTFVSAPRLALGANVVDRFRASFEKKVRSACREGVSTESKPHRTRRAAPLLGEDPQLPLRPDDHIEPSAGERD